MKTIRISLLVLFLSGIVSIGLQAQEEGEFTDKRDGITYKTVKIGNQTWMAENLKFKTEECWKAGGEEGNFSNYGYLYSWKSAMKACPAGWHLATDAEWEAMISKMGGEFDAAVKLKNISGWKHFYGKNYGSNESGFSALPGGYYVNGEINKDFKYINESAYFWTSTSSTSNEEVAKSKRMTNMDGQISKDGIYKTAALSVRCLKD